MRRVLVTGSRFWEDQHVVWEALRDEFRENGQFILVHGDCPTGADRLADQWGMLNWFQIEKHKVDWYPDPHHKYDPTAGFKRNQKMVDLGADVCLAFLLPCRKPSCPKVNIHASHGTTHCVERAEAAGIPVRRFEGM